MTKEELIDRVTQRTKGSAGDPLTRDEVAQIVDVTLEELGIPEQTPETQDEAQ